jgi:hypothetical protein
MEWISFFDRKPTDGQTIYYYGKYIGVWRGRYNYSPNDPVSPHLFFCSTHGIAGRVNAPWMLHGGNPTKVSRYHLILINHTQTIIQNNN